MRGAGERLLQLCCVTPEFCSTGGRHSCELPKPVAKASRFALDFRDWFRGRTAEPDRRPSSSRAVCSIAARTLCFVIASDERGSSPDPVLIRSVARAHRWVGLLGTSPATSITDLARTEGLQRAYVSSHLPLAFLAPNIVAAILDGTQPASLTLDRLMRVATRTGDWREQRASLTGN